MTEIKGNNLTVKIYESETRGDCEIRYRIGGHTFRESRSDIRQATHRAEDIVKLHDSTGFLATENEMAELAFCREKLKGSGASLVDAVLFYLANVQPTIQLGQAAREFLNFKGKQGLNKVTVRALTVHLALLESCVGITRELVKITVSDLDSFLIDYFDNPVTRKNYRRTLIQFFRWARTRGYLPEGTTAAEQTHEPKVTPKDPIPFKPSEVRDLLDTAKEENPALIPVLALGAFAGLRNCEIRRLTWDHLDFTNHYIILGSDITKTGQRRVVPMTSQVKAWLLESPRKGTKICQVSNTHKATAALAKKVGVPWVPNGLRKGFITYSVASGTPADEVCAWTGHAKDTLERHYKGLATPDRAASWFSIFPCSPE